MSKPTLLVILGAVLLAAAIALNSLVDWDGSRRDASNAPQTPSSTSAGLEAPQIARTPTAPSFDVVRINPNGDAVLAGRATPGSEVTILEGETVIGRVQADERGEWVLVPDKPLEPGARVFSLESKAPDQAPVKSESEVVLVVPEQEGGGALALRVPNQAAGSGTGPATVLQSPFPSAGTGGVAIGIIDYDENGKASVSGKAKPGARLNVYLDEKLAGSAHADNKGEWNFALPAPVAAGQHRLRIDELGPDGKVAGRAEFAFARKPPGDNGLSTGAIVVVEGNSLWRIARRSYGEGTRYMLIVEANREQIKDPDLIYPGQVFELPRR